MSEEKVVTSSRVRAPRKPKTSQIPQAIILTIAAVAFGYFLAGLNPKMPTFWLFGILFGYVLQRSRFCFTAGFRDPCITGSTSITRAMLVAFAVGTVGFTALKYQSAMSGAKTTIEMMNVTPIGVPLILGGLMFGIGMVLAGGCASGTLMRVGEGFLLQIVALFFFVMGNFWAAHDTPMWSKMNEGAPKIFLPHVFGWFWALVVQFTIIVLLYIAAIKWQEKKMGSSD